MEARQRFLQRTEMFGAEVDSIRRASAESNSELFTDVGYIGHPEPKRVLLISSGLHGVEGFFGSAVQLLVFDLLEQQSIRFDKSAIVLVHALNPFGFHNTRRVDENNVDLNRNFLLPGEEYRGAPEAYRKLDPLLNPRTWPQQEIPFRWQAYWKVLRHGLPFLKQAIAAGQYDYPAGLFYGGGKPSATLQMVEEQLSNWTRNALNVLHLDLHTGLGKSGECALLFDEAMSNEERGIWRGLFGEHVLHDSPNQRHYQAQGTFNRWLERRYRPGQLTSFCAEFGTFGPIQIIEALRAENAAWHNAQHVESSPRLSEFFCPQNSSGAETWRSKVLVNARKLLSQAVLWLQRGDRSKINTL